MAASMAALAKENNVDDDTNPWPARNHRVLSLLLEKMEPFLFLDKLFDEGVISKDEWITLQQISNTEGKNAVKELMGRHTAKEVARRLPIRQVLYYTERHGTSGRGGRHTAQIRQQVVLITSGDHEDGEGLYP